MKNYFNSPPLSLFLKNKTACAWQIFLACLFWVFSTVGHVVLAQCNPKVDFNFTVTGCSVQFVLIDAVSPPSPVNWDFGDMTTGTGNPVTHTYSMNGTYTVTASHTVGGITYSCTKQVQVTGCNMECCEEDFTASVTRDCGALLLSLSAECSAGAHEWAVTTVPAGECFTLVNFNSSMPSQNVQLTNLNTCIVTDLLITHTVTCPGGGSLLVSTQTIAVPGDGIYIGRRNATTNLQAYNCVLPGAGYNGACPVYVSGIVGIDKSFTFDGTDIHMDPGMTGFDVLNTHTLKFERDAYVHGAADCNCLWRGIYVQAGGELRFDGPLSFSAMVEDALYAVRMYYGSSLYLKDALFSKNFVCVRATDSKFLMTGYENNEFDGLGPLKGICGLSGLNDLSIIPLASGTSSISYSTGMGYAGWFISGLPAINFTSLSYAGQNIFRNMAKGIEVYDTDFSLDANSVFLNIEAGGSYLAEGTAGIRFGDTGANGNNTFRFAGNGVGSSAPTADFDVCNVGIALRSEVNGTFMDIGDAQMINAQVGIWLDAASGAFWGNDNISPGNLFSGVHDNLIEVEPVNLISGYETAGIFFRDWDASLSDLRLTRNHITLEYESPNGSSGIRALGAIGNVVSGTQLEIDRNTIVVNQGRKGIFLDGYGQASVHDHNASQGGAGIFMNWNVAGATTAGIHVNAPASAANLISCNEVTSTASGVLNLAVSASPDNNILRNYLIGPSVGAAFLVNCGTATQFRCNTMDNNIGNGLRYTAFAQTGPQGIPFTASHGNLWVGSFTPGESAYADGSVTFINSLYYVRSVVNENPLPNVNPLSGWFAANVPNGNEPDCFLDCPTEDPRRFLARSLSSLDSLIAQGTDQYDSYAELLGWWNDRYLYEKLFYNPGLSAGNTIMQVYVNEQNGTAMADLVQMTGRIDSLYRLSDVQQDALEANGQVAAGLLAELAAVDALIQTEASADLLAQRETLLNELENIHAANSLIQAALDQQRQEGIAPLFAHLDAIEPDNNFEAIEKEVLQILVKTVVARTAPEAVDLNRLQDIGSLCVLEGGPAIYLAQSLYSGFTGRSLTETVCWDVAERGGSLLRIAPPQNEVVIYPNPAGDYLHVQLAQENSQAKSDLTIADHLGRQVLQTTLHPGYNQIALHGLPPGSYQIKVVQGSASVFVKVLSIHR